MFMMSVSSGNLDSAGYDECLKILHIQFNNGSLYEYYDVPKNIYLGLITASSAGKYFAEYIKGKYNYSRI